MDTQLQQAQKAIRSGLIASCALQQGLLRLKDHFGPEGDPAVAQSVLQDVFEASQDAIDQMGRASALQHYTRRLQAIKVANLGGSEFEKPLLRMPLQEGWLFGDQIGTITETCKAQRAVTSLITSGKSKPKPSFQNKKPRSGNDQHRATPPNPPPRNREQSGRPQNSFRHGKGGRGGSHGGKGYQGSGNQHQSGQHQGSQPTKNP
jgi:hypothetical protein